MTEVLRFARHAFAIAAIGLALAPPANAGHDERDNPDVVAHKLNNMGFVSWRRIDWHHHFWQVDDARRANGKIYNLRLEAETLDLVRLERQGRY